MINTEVFHELSEEFTLEEIYATSRRGGLLTMEIEFSLRCNYGCPYCYVPSKSELANEFVPEVRPEIIPMTIGTMYPTGILLTCCKLVRIQTIKTVPRLKSNVRPNSLQNEFAEATNVPIAEYGLPRINPSGRR